MTDRPIASEVIAHLGTLRKACGLIQVAIPTETLTDGMAGAFAEICVTTAENVLAYTDPDHPPPTPRPQQQTDSHRADKNPDDDTGPVDARES